MENADVRTNSGEIEVSVILPCLNEENTLAMCIRAARKALEEAGIRGEIVVADNGSTDRSREIALEEGAQVVDEKQTGYGNAVRAGLASAQGHYLVFLDADMSYDFGDIPRFVEELRSGADVVIGSRFRGGIERGAMPVLHRLVGTPGMTKLANILFGCKITDINCGMRGLTKEAFQRLDLHSEGMEFASEMIIKAAREKMRIVEIPTAFRVDRRGRAPHLHSFRDGWRHLQLMLHFCPLWLYLVPGFAFLLGGLAVIFVLSPGTAPRFLLTAFLIAQACAAVGVQVLLLGLVAQDRVKAPRWRTVPFVRSFRKWFTLPKGLALGLSACLVGMVILGYALFYAVQSKATGQVSAFDATSLRLAFLGATLFVCGLQVFCTSLFLGLFGIRVADDGR